MSFPRYPKYKPSGVEWLGEVPDHWDVVPLKRLIELQNGRDYKSIEVADGYPVIGSGGVFAFASDYLFDGESVLLGRKGTIDKPLHVRGAFWTVDTMFWSRIAEDACGRFSYYVAQTLPFAMYATNTALPSMAKSDLEQHRVAVPGLDEQRSIASFLDRECEAIDGLVAEQERLIELLKEKRLSVISHAVTKGLDPDAPMKSSGIEWLGDVPEHWKVSRLKRVAEVRPSNVDKKSYEGEVSVALCNYVDVYYNDEVTPTVEFMEATASVEQCERFTLRAGDVVITKDSESASDIAVAAHVPADLPGVVCGYHLALIRPRHPAHGAYLKWLFGAHATRASVAVRANGLTRVGLSQYALDNLELPLPPLAEQQAIALECARQAQVCDELMRHCEHAIALLRERRSALISAAVTGQIDVRNLVPSEVA